MHSEEREQEGRGWPSRKPFWTFCGMFCSVAVLMAMSVWQCGKNWKLFAGWTELQQAYFNTYVRTLVQPWAIDFRFVERVTPKGRFVAGNEDLLSAAQLEWGPRQSYNCRKLHSILKEKIYGSRSPWEM